MNEDEPETFGAESINVKKIPKVCGNDCNS